MRYLMILSALIVAAAATGPGDDAFAGTASATIATGAPFRLSCSFSEVRKGKPQACMISAEVCSVTGAACSDSFKLRCRDGTRVSVNSGVETTFEEGDLTLQAPSARPSVSFLVRFFEDIQGSERGAVLRIGDNLQEGLLSGTCDVLRDGR